MSFILVLILLKRKLKIKVGYPVNVRIMIRIKYSWVLLLYCKIFCSFSMSCESVTGFYFSFVCAGVVVAEVGAEDSHLLISGSLSLCSATLPQPLESLSLWGKRAIFSHDSHSHIPVIRHPNALILIIFQAPSMPSQFVRFLLGKSVSKC